MKQMSSRERVLRAFAREPSDRIPMDYAANPGIDRACKQRLGLASDDDEGIKEILGIDFREISVPYIGPVLHSPRENRQVDPAWGFVTRRVEHETGAYWDYCDYPIPNIDEETAETWLLPDPDAFDYTVVGKQTARWPEKALYVGNPGLADILNTTGMLSGMEYAYIALAERNPAWLRLTDRRLAVQLEVTARVLEHARGRIDFLWLGEDLGAQNGPLIAPAAFKDVLKPRHIQFVRLAESWNIPVMMHSCGSASWVYDEFIDMGISAVDTLQPDAADMDPRYLKERFGQNLAFHGGFSTAGAVVQGCLADLRQELEYLLGAMTPGGGYMFSPTHMLQDNSNADLVLSAYEYVRNWPVR